MGSLLESAITVASRDIRHQSVGEVVKCQAPSDAHLTSRPCQSRINGKKRNKKASFYQGKMPSVIYKVFWLGSLKPVRVPIVSHHLTIDKITGKKF